MPSTRVYVGGLSSRCRERAVEKLFRDFGRLKEVSLKNGFAFVEFDDYRDADDAVYDLNGKEFMGNRVSVEIARGTPHGRDRDRWGSSRRDPSPRGRDSRRPGWLDKYGPPTRTDYRLTVENLSSRVSWQDLKDYMRQAGDVCYADAHKNHRGEGCVEFAREDDMEAALDKLDGTELNGKKIKLIKPSSRGRRRSRSRSRSPRGRSRSRSPRGRSRSPRGRSRSPRGGRSKSRSPRGKRSKSRSRSSSGSRDKSRSSRSRSRSASVNRNGDHRDDRDRSESRSPGRRDAERRKKGRSDDEDDRD